MSERESLPLLLRAKGKYIVPNAITAANMVMGLISIYYASRGFHATAAWIIGYAIILDKLDGSTARMLNASSDFGVQFDSFSDFISFGIAPAFIVFSLLNSDPYAASFAKPHEAVFLYVGVVFFILMSASRLARFNVTTMPNTRYMFGLPTPGAAGFIITFILTGLKYADVAFFSKWLLALPYILIAMGVMEISNFAILKVGKRENLSGKAFEVFGFLFLAYCFVTRSLPEVLFIMGVVYILYVFGYNLKNRDKIRKELEEAGVEVEED